MKEFFGKVNWKKVLNKARNVSLILAGVFLMAACIIYIFATDLFATNTSFWLLGGALLGFGAGISSLLSEVKKEKTVLVYLLKGISLALMIGFVLYLSAFEKSNVVTSLDVTDKFKEIECIKAINVSMIITYVLSYIGIAIQVFNVSANVILGVEK